MELEPAYLTIEPMPFGPRVATDGLFEGLAGEIDGVLGDGDTQLASLQTAIAENSDAGLDATFTATIGAAADATAAQGSPETDQTGGRLVDAGAGSEAYRQSVLSVLPQPDAPIEGNFKDFPQLGEGRVGDGGVESGDRPVNQEA